ncbi:hypothetical protein [Flavobacterium capsici]|uniref:Uncharacterized protein n=1 Tax=Flavobacterium capsici TaxID=3075618 RepID=A0AA96F271_9FLAO|nr:MULTISPECIES: hypothetical protein [unclassified Flavobacterium]WNM18228.1 hypothetical protein RN608_09395 [Flavobacterium sp. PMR2A8]WNM22279.1 hypothetical protein RN605_02695 [Flavobacterium sp. PMTSA4]
MKKLVLSILFIFILSNFSVATNKTAIDSTKVELQKDPKVGSFRYYYYPNLEAYFDVRLKKYIYKDKEKWVYADKIPSNYRGYSAYNKYYIILTDVKPDNEEPYLLIEQHKKKYPADYKGKYVKTKVR